MKLDIKLDKDEDENIKFSMDYDKEFSDNMGKCIEGWVFIIREVINMNTPKLYPTEIHNISIPEKEEPKNSIHGEVVLEEDKEAVDISTSRDVVCGDTYTRTGTDPPTSDPVGKESDHANWNGKTTKAPSK